jgi:hypothetical protein
MCKFLSAILFKSGELPGWKRTDSGFLVKA